MRNEHFANDRSKLRASNFLSRLWSVNKLVEALSGDFKAFA
jgi:hypothetical protein